MSGYQPGKFEIDGMKPSFPGFYTPGNTWNGWQRPAFRKAVAERVMKWKLVYIKMMYDPKTDTFWGYSTDNREWEGWPGKDITVNGKKVHVYPIGAGAWIWDLA